MDITIEIAHNSDLWDKGDKAVINSDFFSHMLQLVMQDYPNFAKITGIELSVLLTDSKEMQALNSQFRGKEKPTNVLSFPFLEIECGKILEFTPEEDYIYLGDMAFGFEVIAKEAELYNISFINHFTHLTIHSLLHLLGYDHVEDDDAEIMQNIEEKILQLLKISSPYEKHYLE